jgi:hypothetical protein
VTDDRRHDEAVERDREDRERYAIRREEREAGEREEKLEERLESLDDEAGEARKLVEREVEKERGTDHQHPPPDAPP